MITRILSFAAVSTIFALTGCAVEELDAPEQEDDVEASVDAAGQHPARGVYNTSNVTNGFPLGRCGYQGSAAVRNEQLNEHNSPYVMEWDDDAADDEYCMIIKRDPDNCSKAKDPAACRKRLTMERKIAFPLDWSGSDSCLTESQRSRLESDSNMKLIDIGYVTMSDAKSSSSSARRVGRLKIFRHGTRYQYEMMAFGGSPTPFKPWEGKSDLADVKVCVERASWEKIGLRDELTPRACMHFADEKREREMFGEMGTEGTAYSFYDVATHEHCPVAFTPTGD